MEIFHHNGHIIRISDEFLELMLNGKSIIFFGWSYGVPGSLPDYDWLDVKGKRVLDVGASIGDTAVYFALRGAREVVAFEPYPFPYQFALRNVEVNGLSNVRVINASISGNDARSGSPRARPGIPTTSSLRTSRMPSRCQVPIYSLDRVLEEYGLRGRGNEAEKILRFMREESQYVSVLHIRSEVRARMCALVIFDIN